MGKLAKIKTQENDSSVENFIGRVEDEQMRKDCKTIIALMQKVSNQQPKMWGNSLIGFGNRRYKSPKTGREVDWFKIGFSPRKANLSLHLVFDMKSHFEILSDLGKHKTGSGCLYIKKLSDVDITILEKLIQVSLEGK
ncbi:MAG: DUF1801 domain-containing protein [Saprospiraceae bacterium]|nr:DUF1801 domain-containing protein [Saprospiraceae bacterium]